MIRKIVLASLIFAVAQVSCSDKKPSADLIVRNGTIWTGNAELQIAQAMAVKDGLVVYVGDENGVLPYQGENTEVLDLQNQFVTPGFIDSHIHFMEGGSNLSSVQLRDAASPEEFITRIGDFAKTVPEGTWITGGDWDHMNWGGELPERAWVDSVTSRHPLWINRLDGHMALANSRAIELAGIGPDPDELSGGEMVRKNGELTGIFKDNAMSYIAGAVSEPSLEVMQKHLSNAMKFVNAQGVTSIHNMGTFNDLDQFKIAHDNGELTVRIYASTPLAAYQTLAEEVKNHGNGDNWLRIGGLKGFVDGSLGSHTAVFHQPYTDRPDYSGIYVTDLEQLSEDVRGASAAGLQVSIHAIGDKAIHDLLNIYDDVIQEDPKKDYRFRIEHTQHLDASDIPRFRELRVIASMQPYHQIDDGRWADGLIGPERAEYTYAFKSLLDAGAVIAFGSDWFVAPPTPLEGIYGAVTRRTLDDMNPGGWIPEQKISVEEALVAYTRSAAYASFEEDIKGSLEVGKLADFVVLSKNLLDIDPIEIRNVKVEATYVGGKAVYTSK